MQDLFYQDSDFTGDVQNSKMKIRLKDETSVLIILINKSARCHWYFEWEEMFFITPTKGSLPNIPGPRELPAFITTSITPWGLYNLLHRGACTNGRESQLGFPMRQQSYKGTWKIF